MAIGGYESGVGATSWEAVGTNPAHAAMRDAAKRTAPRAGGEIPWYMLPTFEQERLQREALEAMNKTRGDTANRKWAVEVARDIASWQPAGGAGDVVAAAKVLLAFVEGE